MRGDFKRCRRERDVVAKFHDAHLDLGIGHGLIVALAGARPRAMEMAQERGMTVWGPDEMQPHLGKAQLVGLQNRPMIEEVGFPRPLTSEAARALLEKETSGRFRIGKEEVTWSGDAWLPVSVVQMTLLQWARSDASRPPRRCGVCTTSSVARS